jgi:SAM-dependent methyltransferase
MVEQRVGCEQHPSVDVPLVPGVLLDHRARDASAATNPEIVVQEDAPPSPGGGARHVGPAPLGHRMAPSGRDSGGSTDTRHYAESVAESPWQVRDVTAEYEAGRPDYPPALAQVLIDEIGVTPESVVLDLAAGTGKLTRAVLPLVGKVIALDPAASMLNALRASLPATRLVAGRAEVIPLRDSALDSVLVGNAFHWFRADQALAEVTRVVRSGGSLAVVWNIPEFERAAASQIGELLVALAPYRGSRYGGDEFLSGRWLECFERSPDLGPLGVHRLEYDFPWTREGLRAYVASWSSFATLGEPVRTEVLSTVAQILADASEPVWVPHRFDAYWTFKP